MEETQGAAPKKGSMMLTMAAIAVVTLIGGGGGWVLGGIVASPPVTEEQAALNAEVAAAIQAAKKQAPEADANGGKKKDEGLPKVSTEANGIVQLDPITTNLSYPTQNWIRLEVALLFKGTPDVAMAEQIQQDIAAYLKTVSLQQIQGPRGFQYLKDDIQERVDLRSEGRVTNVIFRTFVVQ